MNDASAFRGLQIAAISDHALRHCAKATALYTAPVSDTQKLLGLMGYAFDKASKHKTIASDPLSLERSFQDMIQQSRKFHATLYYIHQLLKTAPYIDFDKKFTLDGNNSHRLSLREMAHEYVLFGVDKNSPLLVTVGQYFSYRLQQRLQMDETTQGKSWRMAETAFFNQMQSAASL